MNIIYIIWNKAHEFAMDKLIRETEGILKCFIRESNQYTNYLTFDCTKLKNTLDATLEIFRKQQTCSETTIEN